MTAPTPYAERRSTRAPAVVWTRVSAPGHSVVLPDGCMDVLWNGTDLVLAGPDTAAVTVAATRPVRWAAVRLDPGVGPTVAGVPAHAVVDDRVPLADLWPGDQVAAWTELLGASADPASTLERLVAERLHTGEQVPTWVGAAVDALGSGVGVRDTADLLGVTERQLHRRCLARFGYGPQVLHRVLRLQAAVRDLDAGRTPAEVAAGHGYADQPHLHRELRRFTGTGSTRQARRA